MQILHESCISLEILHDPAQSASKFLARLRVSERERVKECVEHIIQHDFAGLDLKKLKGYATLYRVRIGSLRIIFDDAGPTPRVISIDRKTEDTYRHL